MFKYFKNKAKAKALRLAKQKLKRNMGFSSFSNIKKAGIIVRHTIDIENVAINKLLDFMKRQNIDTTILIHYPEKKLPANIPIREGTLLFATGDTNWFGKPNKKEIETFINTEFDLLIDLTSEEIYSLQYILHASKASFKVGKLSYADDPYDFVVIGDQNGNDEKYIDDLFKYMAKVN